jgi:hypothetical protein
VKQPVKRGADFEIDNSAEELSSSQTWFEENCGGQKLGQEIMVTVGIGQFYTSKAGFDSDNLKKAQAIYEAFKRSSCSTEVKEEVDKIAEDYRLYGK